MIKQHIFNFNRQSALLTDRIVDERQLDLVSAESGHIDNGIIERPACDRRKILDIYTAPSFAIIDHQIELRRVVLSVAIIQCIFERKNSLRFILQVNGGRYQPAFCLMLNLIIIGGTLGTEGLIQSPDIVQSLRDRNILDGESSQFSLRIKRFGIRQGLRGDNVDDRHLDHGAAGQFEARGTFQDKLLAAIVRNGKGETFGIGCRRNDHPEKGLFRGKLDRFLTQHSHGTDAAFFSERHDRLCIRLDGHLRRTSQHLAGIGDQGDLFNGHITRQTDTDISVQVFEVQGLVLGSGHHHIGAGSETVLGISLLGRKFERNHSISTD